MYSLRNGFCNSTKNLTSMSKNIKRNGLFITLDEKGN